MSQASHTRLSPRSDGRRGLAGNPDAQRTSSRPAMRSAASRYFLGHARVSVHCSDGKRAFSRSCARRLAGIRAGPARRLVGNGRRAQGGIPPREAARLSPPPHQSKALAGRAREGICRRDEGPARLRPADARGVRRRSAAARSYATSRRSTSARAARRASAQLCALAPVREHQPDRNIAVRTGRYCDNR